MGAGDFAREWAQHLESQVRAGHGPWADAGAWTGGARVHGRGGPPPWLSGLFGLVNPDAPRPKARRGDVRAAILDVLATETLNGYQLIGQISERSGGAWRPSPGSVYPTLSQLEDEGLIVGAEAEGRRAFSLTDAGRAYVTENREELDSVWVPFQPGESPQGGVGTSPGFAGLRPELGQVMNAVWQIITVGTDEQRKQAVAVLVETRRKLYGILAEGESEQ